MKETGSRLQRGLRSPGRRIGLPRVAAQLPARPRHLARL